MDFEESLAIISDKLTKRQTERQQELEKKRGERAQSAASNEKLDFFFKTFNEKRQEIEDELNTTASGTIKKSELPYHFDKVVKGIQNLQKYTSTSAYFLRVYDVRKTQETLQELQQKCQELEEWLLPKTKFSFKVRKTASKTKKETFGSETNGCVNSSENLLGKPLAESICGFTERVSENLTMKYDTILTKDVILSHLENCTIHLPGVPSTLHITDLRNSRVLCGPVMTSIFIEDCTDCTFVLACQQMRIHNTRHCDFYMHVTSRAIMEDTKEVRFAPYRWKYDDMNKHFEVAGLDLNRNNWEFIDDFNWLASDKPSPHWRVIKESEQNLDWA